MPATRAFFFRLPAALRLLAALAAFGLAALTTLAEETKTLSDNVTAEFGKLRELTDAKNYPAALQTLDRLIAGAAPESYDSAVLAQIKAQVLLNAGQNGPAIAPLELALQLGERHSSYLEERIRLETLYLLAQLYQQQAGEVKDASRQRALLEKSADYLRRWQTLAPALTPEVGLFAASLFYQQAMLDPEKPDLAKLRETEDAVGKTLPLQLRPNPSLYLLWLAALQQRGDSATSADLLELLVSRQPSNTGYWQQLTSNYLTLAGAATNDRDVQRYNLRALLTLERAQARGLLTSPRENFSLIALYLNLQQFAPAIALLEKGLADGLIEKNRGNWQLLASAYQQQRNEDGAIATLEKAVRAFPADGQLEFDLAQHFYGRAQLDRARAHLESAIAKGHLDKPGQVRLFFAYTAYEMKHYTDALRLTQEAAAFGDVKKDDLARLTRAINDAVRDQASAKS